MEKYLQALRNTSKQLEADFDKSIQIQHSASKGSMREEIISNLIRPFLPDIYGLTGGECFSVSNEVSKQLDLIIYDKLYSYRIPLYDNFVQFPCESVYGNVEVKTFLNKDEFIKSVNNIASLKKLKREKTTLWDITPYTRVNIGGGIKSSTTACANNYLGIVFAYDSPDIETVMKYFAETNEKGEYFPDFFVIYKKKTIICKYIDIDESLEVSFYTDKFKGYIAIRSEEDTLPIFISETLNILRNIHLRAPNIAEYPRQQLTQKLSGAKEYIISAINSKQECKK